MKRRRWMPADFQWPRDLIWVGITVLVVGVVVGTLTLTYFAAAPRPYIQNGYPMWIGEKPY